MSNIVYKDRDVVIVNKDAGVSSQADKTGDKSIIEELSSVFLAEGENTRIFPVHRLDKVVGGLLLLARNKQTASVLSEGLSGEEFSKDYLAVVEGEISEGEYKDYLLKNSILAKSEVVSPERKGAKLAKLFLSPLAVVQTEKGNRSLVKIKLSTGRFHQIRAQLSSRGNYIVGDKKYGSRDLSSRFPALFAYRISFALKGKNISQSILPDSSLYPWNLFDKNIYEELLK